MEGREEGGGKEGRKTWRVGYSPGTTLHWEGWLHPSDDEDGGHNQDGIGNDHEDAMRPNKVCAHSVHTHLPYADHGVHWGIADGGVWPTVIGKAPITTYRERRNKLEFCKVVKQLLQQNLQQSSCFHGSI